jgi:hypothetical protein
VTTFDVVSGSDNNRVADEFKGSASLPGSCVSPVFPKYAVPIFVDECYLLGIALITSFTPDFRAPPILVSVVAIDNRI